MYGFEPNAQRSDHVPDEIVRQRPRSLYALLVKCDGRGLDGANPDR
jgi:hypothetical protein